VLRPVGVPEIPVETAALARRVHPRGTDEMRVRDALGPLFGDEDFTAGELEDMYPRLGQPGLSPALLLMVTILQFRHNLSDREAAQAVADRISWKYALGLELDYTGFDASVLCEFRARLAEGGRADALLEGMLERLKAAGLVRAGGRQRTDSTHVIACVRRLNRIESVGEACGPRWRRSPGSPPAGWSRCCNKAGTSATAARWKPPGCWGARTPPPRTWPSRSARTDNACWTRSTPTRLRPG
jgi:transposase